MRKLLYLLVGVVALLGGCSRCDHDDPTPNPSHSKLFISTSSVKQTITSISHAYPLPYVVPLANSDSFKSVIDTNGIYLYNARITFLPSDTTWDHYIWHFEEGRVLKGVSQTFLFQMDYTLDSVSVKTRVSAYNMDGSDSASAIKTIWFYKEQKVPSLGTYSGIFSDGATGNVIFSFDPNGNYWHINGMLNHFCPSITAPQIFQMSSTSWIVFETSGLDQTSFLIPNCSLSRTTTMYGYYHFDKDSVYARIDTENQAFYRLTFKGKKR